MRRIKDSDTRSESGSSVDVKVEVFDAYRCGDYPKSQRTRFKLFLSMI